MPGGGEEQHAALVREAICIESAAPKHTVHDGDVLRAAIGPVGLRWRLELARAFPAPFNAAKGEGNLISHSLVVSYPTAASGTQPGLDTMYVAAICAGLTPSQCAGNKASLDTPAFGNFNVDADSIGKNPLGIKLVDAVKVTYTAINVDQSALTVSGAILVPEVAPT